MTSQQIAARKWTHVDSVTGAMLTWKQEDEAACQSHEEAVGILQRTLDFWIVKLRDAIMVKNGLTVAKATEEANMTFFINLEFMLTQPWPRKWDLKLSEFSLLKVDK